MKKALSLAILLLTMTIAHAQMVDPVKFSASLKTGSTAEGEIVFSGNIDEGWHVYSCLLYTSPSPRDATLSRMPSSA